MIVALDGPDGAGKSMQVERAVDWAHARGRSARVIGKWQIFEPGVVPEARFVRGTRREELRVCISEMTSPARMMFLAWMNTLTAERAQRADEDLVLLDGYWAKHAASELLAGCPERLVDAVTDAIAPVDLTIYLDVTPVEALRRKDGDLAPYECGRDPQCRPERFLAHQAAVRDILLSWASSRGWAVVAAGTPEETHERIRAIISPRLFAHPGSHRPQEAADDAVRPA